MDPSWDEAVTWHCDVPLTPQAGSVLSWLGLRLPLGQSDSLMVQGQGDFMVAFRSALTH